MHPAIVELSRRRFIQLGAGGIGSLSLGSLLRAESATGTFKSPSAIRSCILVFYYGGPSQLETYDPKPEGPSEVRGEFSPIATSAPGVFIGEHLPHMAKVMHHACIIRTMTHQARLHDSASIHALTGRPLSGPDRELFEPLPQETPSYGSVVAHLRGSPQHSVPFAALPFRFRNVHEVPCQGGGFLGRTYDPLEISQVFKQYRYSAEMIAPAEGVGPGRSSARRELLSLLDSSHLPGGDLPGLYRRAYELLDSREIAEAINIRQESEITRDRYGYDREPVPPATPEDRPGAGLGREMRGQNLLLARRLVEAGVPFVNVYDFQQQGTNWDAHFGCCRQHRDYLLPAADRGLAALVTDLEERGLLDSTLIVAMGEFGRTPRFNTSAGRDHWPDCYSALLIGGGVKGGTTHGKSDNLAAYPDRDPVTPGDLAATIFWRFGIDPATEIFDSLGRPHRAASGEPLRHLFRV